MGLYFCYSYSITKLTMRRNRLLVTSRSEKRIIMVKYLFLDAKWEQRCASIENDANELLELAGIGMSDDGKVTDRIFRIVRPEGDKKISKGTKFFLNLTDKKIATGASLHTALTDFLDMFSEFQWIIVWNYRVYEIFLAKVRKISYTL